MAPLSTNPPLPPYPRTSMGGALPGARADAALPEAIKRFFRSTEEAQRAFDALGSRVEELKGELAQTNRQLREKVEALDHLNGHLVSLLDSLSDAVVAFDQGAAIRLFNPAAEALTGHRSSELLGQPLSLWLPRDAEIRSMVDTALLSGRSIPRQRVHLTRAEGSPLPVAASAAAVRDADGMIIGAVLVMQDLEELLTLQDQVRRTAGLAAIGRMAAVVAHEIRNPLGGVEGFASLLSTDPAIEGEQKRYVNMILGGIQDLNRLVNNLLDYARPPELELQTVDLAQLLPELSALVKADTRFAKTNIKHTLHSNTRDGVIVGDRGALRQVFLNLMKNAVEAMEPQGSGQLRLRIADDMLGAREAVRIEVADTGMGIEQELQGKIFEPFITTKPKGTGLGLPTVAKLVQAHGGKVECLEEPHGGCCFTVVFARQ